MTLKIGILGCGGMAGGHAKRLVAMEGVELSALCDVSEDIVNGFIERNELASYNPKVFTDAGAMYSESALDGVVIVTPHTMHYDHGVQALEAGCHVMMEKPMVTSTEQAKKLKEKVDETGKILIVGFNTPCTPVFRYLRDAIRNETFGKLEMVNGYLTQNWLKATQGTWRQKPELSGGGQAYDSGAHILNSLVWSVESEPELVFSFVDNHGAPVDINSVTNVKFKNGVIACIAISGNCINAGSDMVFIFENGRIRIDGWGGGYIEVFGPDGKIEDPGIQGEGISPVQNFVESIRGNDTPMATAVNGIHHSQLMDAIYASAENGAPV